MKPQKIVIILIILAIAFGIFYALKGNETETEKQTEKQETKQETELTPTEAVMRARELYQQKRQGGMQFSSQCLGTVGQYAVDIVHVPRSEEDNKPENQCQAYREGKLKHFIELDKNGNIVRVV